MLHTLRLKLRFRKFNSIIRLVPLTVAAIGHTTAWGQSPVSEQFAVGGARVVEVRGQATIIEDLVMGPEGAAYWNSIQAFISSLKSIEAPKKVADQLELNIIERRVPRPANEYRQFEVRPIAGNLFLTQASYGIGTTVTDPSRLRVSLALTMNPSKLCITESEVRRLYGAGTVAFPTPGSPSPRFNAQPEGTRHSRAYGAPLGTTVRDNPIVFTFSESSCLEQLYIQQFVAPSNSELN